MSAASWPAHRALLLQVVREETGYRPMKRITWLLMSAALVVMLVFHHFGQTMAGKGMAALLLWGLAHMWCGAFLKSAIAQNRPEYATLVPQLRATLMRLTGLLFIASSLLLSALATLLFGYAGYALLAGGLMSVYTLFTSRYPWLALSPAALVLLLIKTGYMDTIALVVHQELGQFAITVLGSLPLLALGAWGLRMVFPQGGDEHWAWFKRQSLAREALSAPTQRVPLTRFGVWWQDRRGSRYLAALRADSRTGGTPQRMMMYALGPSAHPAGYMMSVLVNTIAALALLAAAEGRLTPNSYLLMGNVIQWAVLASSIMYIQSVRDSVSRYRTEQAIFFLSAGAPAVAQVNRLLGGAILRRFLLIWLTTLAGVTVIDSLIQRTAGLRGVTFMLAVMMLPLACTALRNYAATQASSKGPSWVVWTVLYMIVCNFVMSVANARHSLPWFWLGGIFAAVSLLVLYRRWRTLLTLPPVLHAARLAA